MKRFTVVTGVLGLSILALWAVSQIALASSSKAKANSTTGEMAVPVTGADVRVAPLYDANGILLSDPSGVVSHAIAADVKIAPVYDAYGNLLSDPSGTVSNAVSSGAKIAPVFDTTGAVVSDPTGTILNANNP